MRPVEAPMSTAITTRTNKDTAIGYLLWVGCFFGFCGLHRIYSGRIVSGLIWFFTGGLCGVGQIIDLFLLPRMIQDYNAGRDVW
jgi:TM2 domain-containing membrane protein YozV